MTDARVWLGPERPSIVADAIDRAGGTFAEAEEANIVVWIGPPSHELIRDVVHPGIRWVQLWSAGPDWWFEHGIVDSKRIWTRVEDVYAADVAEHALAFILAAARCLPQAARWRRWHDGAGDRLAGRTVGIVGAGAIGRETIERLRPFGVQTIALTRTGRPVPGADRSLGRDGLDELLRESDYVVLAAPLTPETQGLIGARELELIGPRGWLVNVARGRLVVTDELVAALENGGIRGACLDVTDPEPLPDDHLLWQFDNVLITPHTANPPGTFYEPLAGLVEENVRRFREERDLIGAIDPDRGY
jgi:phosphoglycerate dehydrogenase-like enzyme